MGIYGKICPPPFYHNSRDIKVLTTMRERIESICRDTPEWTRLLVEFDSEQALVLAKHMEEHRAEVFQTFPGLTFFPPKPAQDGGMPRYDKRDIIAQIRRSSLLTGERRRFKRVRRLMREAAKELPQGLSPFKAKRLLIDLQEKKLFETYGRQYALENMKFAKFRRLMRKAIERTQAFIEQLLDTYIPLHHRKQLSWAASVRNAHDFPTLIALAGKPSGEGVISKRIGHEARVLAVLAQLEFEHLIGTYNPDRVDSIREELIHVFENEVFDPESSLRVVVVAELDPKNSFRVKRDETGKPMIVTYPETAHEAHQSATATRLVFPLDVRVVKAGERLIPVHFDERRKEMIFTKLLRKLYREPGHITDHSGFTCTLFSNGEDEEAFANRLRDKLVVNPGQVWAQASNAARAGAIDPHNPHSSVDRSGEKYNFLWGGITHEIQILDIATYIDSQVSRSRMSHLFYKFLTLVDTTFPFIWPIELYGKDWLEARFRDELWENLIGKLWTGRKGSAIPIPRRHRRVLKRRTSRSA